MNVTMIWPSSFDRRVPFASASALPRRVTSYYVGRCPHVFCLKENESERKVGDDDLGGDRHPFGHRDDQGVIQTHSSS